MAEILVVEEDIELGNSIAGILEKKGHRLARTSDGLEALGRIYDREYDLAILDVALPGIDGGGLAAAIKSKSPQTATIMICSRAEFEEAAEALRTGAYDFLLKPLIEDELIRTVENAVKESRKMRKAGYIYKDERKADKSAMTRRIILTISDSLLVGLAFFLALTVSVHIQKISPQSLTLDLAGFARLSLGIMFCYASSSVFQRSYRFGPAVFGGISAVRVWKNITLAYLAFLGILFLSGNLQFFSGRAAVALGYGLGLLWIIVSRRIVIPFLLVRFRREGKKRIVIVGAEKREEKYPPLTFGRLDSMNPELKRRKYHMARADKPGESIPGEERKDRAASPGDTDDIYVDAESTSASEVLSLLDRYRGRGLKVLLQQTPSELRDEGGPNS